MANKCPECGRPLEEGAPEGLCRACLLKRGLEANTLPGSEIENRKLKIEKWTPPAVGEVAGTFPELEIMELIGRGGMGAVYKARQRGLNRLVALKILPPEIGHDASFKERFAREAQAMARLNHPNIVMIHDFGERNGLFFFLMEYVDGLSLRQLLNASKLSPKEALAIVPQICDALQYAHNAGIVHRDIKPENILLDKTGRVKIADFGLAKLVGEGARSQEPEASSQKTEGMLTQAGAVMGTPAYMAPEQTAHPDAVDHRADIYSLGVVFYQMLTGELPVGKFAPPSKKVVVDVRLDEVVLRALEKEPALRYQQASDVKTVVETIATTGAGETQNARPETQNGGAAVAERPRLSRVAAVGAFWAPWALIVLGGMVGWRQQGPVRTGIEAFVPLMVLALLGLSAPIGTTVCGIVSISQIRRSGGRLHGLPLAVFDALFYPLAAVNALLIWWIYLVVDGMARHTHPEGGAASMEGVLSIALPVCVLVDVVVCLLTWRALTRPLPLSGAPGIASPGGASAGSNLREAQAAVRGPAVGLIVAAVINFVVVLVVMGMFVGIGIGFNQASTGPRMAMGIDPLLLAAMGVILSLRILMGAIGMMKLRGWGSAMTAGILGLVVAPGNIVGIPFGIWAIVVLSRRRTREAFRAAASEERPSRRDALSRAWNIAGLTIAALFFVFGVLLYVGWFLSRPMELHGGGGEQQTLADMPNELQKATTDKVIEAGLSKPLTPWAWQELERRKLSNEDVANIMEGLTAWTKKAHPEGSVDALPWLDEFLEYLTKKHLATDEQAIAFIKAMLGKPRCTPAMRIREGQRTLTVDCKSGNPFHRQLMGFAILQELRGVTVDGQPLSPSDGVNRNWESDWFYQSAKLPALSPGKHVVRVEVLTALVPEGDVAGLGHNAPSSDWPAARKQWVRTAESELQVYAKDAVIVQLSDDPALDPVASKALSVKRIIVRPKGNRAEAVVVFDYKEQKGIPLSCDVALRLGERLVKCGQLRAGKHPDGGYFGGESELVSEMAPLDRAVTEADVVLTPNPELVEDVVGIDRIWEKVVEFKGVKVERQDLAKMAGAGAGAFGNTIERLVTEAIDFDTGKLVDVPEGSGGASGFSDIVQNVEKTLDWAKETGVDAFKDGTERLAVMDMKLQLLKDIEWENATVEQATRALDGARRKSIQPLSGPDVYAFETREGAFGIIQVLDNPVDTGVKVRYKLVGRSWPNAEDRPASSAPAAK